MNRYFKIVYVLITIAVIMITLGVVITIINMLIDHECYQLQPSDFYSSSICERYWK